MQPLCRVQLKQSTIHYPLRKLEPNLHVSSDSVLIDMYSIFGSVGHCHTRNVITWLQTLTRCNSNYHIGRKHHLQVIQQMSTEKSKLQKSQKLAPPAGYHAISIIGDLY
ncbi:hypothetical protein S83_009271 [Arachis hypogaea]